jgi:hypothetical protein
MNAELNQNEDDDDDSGEDDDDDDDDDDDGEEVEVVGMAGPSSRALDRMAWLCLRRLGEQPGGVMRKSGLGSNFLGDSWACWGSICCGVGGLVDLTW